MTYYQIVEHEKVKQHAGSKAVMDMADILSELGFKKLVIEKVSDGISKMDTLKRQIAYYNGWKQIEKNVPHGATVVLQHPFHNKQFTRFSTLKRLKNNKNVKFISIVHDIEELRQMIFNAYYEREFDDMLQLADTIIVHNTVMKEFVVSKGYPSHQIEVLEIFDYLCPYDGNKVITYEKSLIIAGNLDKQKSPYIEELVLLPEVTLNLYGPNLSGSVVLNASSQYFGSFPAEKVPVQLTRGFGLVWDGTSILSCQGVSGQYLKYNSPHKLSLYIASQLPVIVWDKAACADFVIKHGVGLTVSSLTDIPRVLSGLSQEEYNEIVGRTRKVAKQLTTGYFTKKVVEDILKQ